MSGQLVTVSVVSHGQNALVNQLLEDLAMHCAPGLKVIITENVPDSEPLRLPQVRHEFEIIRNTRSKGFGANHNAAFARCRTEFFCVANPDIRLKSDPFRPLAATLTARRASAVAPLVLSAQGSVEDSARHYPTFTSLVRKAFAKGAKPDYAIDQGAIEVDWVAGMFMLFNTEAYRALGGFDERYFLYYEDVDLCRRLRSSGNKVVYEPAVSVIHEARRASRRNPRLMRIHAASALRYLLSRYPKSF
jgi:N-acetylglucosaminyl-diphospho-decaprenol L-rhamnosyltransferase